MANKKPPAPKTTSWNLPYGNGGTTRGTRISKDKGYTQTSHTVNPTPSGTRRVTDSKTTAAYGKPMRTTNTTRTVPAVPKRRGPKAT
jgi:hypothetical protein